MEFFLCNLSVTMEMFYILTRGISYTGVQNCQNSSYYILKIYAFHL